MSDDIVKDLGEAIRLIKAAAAEPRPVCTHGWIQVSLNEATGELENARCAGCYAPQPITQDELRALLRAQKSGFVS